MQYNKGIHTKEMIFQIAKELMYQHGYKHTTISMIAEKANIPPGLVTYYFKKEMLFHTIFENFIDLINRTISEQVEDFIENELQRHILRSLIIPTCMFIDERTQAFYFEIFRLNLLSDTFHNQIRTAQVEILKSFHVAVKQDFYYLCTVAEYGARRELLQLYEKNAWKQKDLSSITELSCTIAVRIAGLSTQIVDENLATAKKLLKKMNLEHIQIF